ncbi:MAG TPA: OB-fold nucleic acid binding domain-containing protein, partial [Acidimicrobiia bacterium]|nr:OB-fold nucleic acid binding domain-containing protein [Acidimicrobiia bacterium]
MATLSRLAAIPVTEVKSLGPKRAAVLAKSGIVTVADLLHHVPRTYLDRSDKPPLARVELGTEVTIIAEVKKIGTRRPKPKLAMTEAVISDDTASLKIVWFNQVYREKMLPPGTQAAFSGTVESFRGKLQMSNPAVDVLDGGEPLVTGRIVPIYPQVGEVKSGRFLHAVHNALKRARPIPDPMPDVLLAVNGLMARDQAFTSIHFPESVEQSDQARRRLVYDEFFRLELSLALRKRRQIEDATGFAHNP